MLAGLALQTPEVTPVVNAQAKRGKLVEATTGAFNDKKIELLSKHLHKNKVTGFKAQESKSLAKAAGLNPSSASYFMKRAVEAGLLRRHGKGSGTSYEVVR